MPPTTEPIPSAAASSSKGGSVASKKQKRIDAMFDDDEGTSDASSSRKPGASRHRVAGSTGKAGRGFSGLGSTTLESLSAKAKLKLEFDPSQLRSLNENRKDVRTIEEIEQDFRRKQALAQPAVTAHASHGLFAVRKTASTSAIPASPAQAPATSEKPRSTVADSSSRPSQANGKVKAKSPEAIKRKRTASPVDSEKRKQPSRSRSPPRKRAASPPSSPPATKLSKTEARRREIWAILNPHKAQEPAFGASYADDSSDEDMEAGIDDIEEEDRRASRIARLEDKKEEERLKQRAKEKAARKIAK